MLYLSVARRPMRVVRLVFEGRATGMLGDERRITRKELLSFEECGRQMEPTEFSV